MSTADSLILRGRIFGHNLRGPPADACFLEDKEADLREALITLVEELARSDS